MHGEYQPNSRLSLIVLAALGIAAAEANAQHASSGPTMMPSMTGSHFFGQSSGAYLPGHAMYPMGLGGSSGGYGAPGHYGGSGAPSMAGYGGSTGGYGNESTRMPVYPQGQAIGQQPGLNAVEKILTASGVPNDGGRLQWPLGLRLLGSPDSDRLRRKAEALFQVAAIQGQSGQINPRFTQEIVQTVEELRRQFQVVNDRITLARTTSEEAELFLNRLKTGSQVLEQTMTVGSGGYGQLRATGAGISQQPR
jgi:hypothetical protein